MRSSVFMKNCNVVNNVFTTFIGYSINWSKPEPNDDMNQFLEQKKINL